MPSRLGFPLSIQWKKNDNAPRGAYLAAVDKTEDVTVNRRSKRGPEVMAVPAPNLVPAFGVDIVQPSQTNYISLCIDAKESSFSVDQAVYLSSLHALVPSTKSMARRIDIAAAAKYSSDPVSTRMWSSHQTRLWNHEF